MVKKLGVEFRLSPWTLHVPIQLKSSSLTLNWHLFLFSAGLMFFHKGVRWGGNLGSRVKKFSRLAIARYTPSTYTGDLIFALILPWYSKNIWQVCFFVKFWERAHKKNGGQIELIVAENFAINTPPATCSFTIWTDRLLSYCCQKGPENVLVLSRA